MATQAPPPPASPSPPPSPPVTEGISTSSPRLPSGGVTGTGTISTSPPAHPPAPIPPPVPVETHPNRTGLKPPPPRRVLTDPNRLAPEDAYYAHSPPRFRSVVTNNHAAHLRLPAAVAALRPPPAVPGAEPRRAKEARRRFGSRRRRPKGAWKKLLWVKQSYPDNYTDTETFLDHLQRNPRLRPYDFWPLVADSTVIVQHVCSVVLFVCCFSGIFQERISPVSVVGWGSICTILGWGLWDFWVGKEQEEEARLSSIGDVAGGDTASISGSSTGSVKATNDDRNQKENQIPSNDLRLSTSNLDCQQLRRHNTGLSTLSAHSHSASACSLHSGNSPQSPNSPMSPFTPINPSNGSLHFPNHCHHPQHSTNNGSTLSPRNRQRLETAKSALLIFCALLGLSPILKSLTKSTTSDSIWAMSCWLMVINIFFFDYSSNSGGSGTGGSGESGATAAKFPASLSTNAAVMASTVLASRLKSTTHVFSLTLFSIEVFGLFPVFRRHLRAISWRGHVLLTVSLVIIASAAVGITLRGGYMSAILGIFIGSFSTALVMGGCSWWLISLQKYKNVVAGPWDPARPVLRRHWD
ncbi:phosphatidylinositol:UDP-GlcNAc transferase PIG-C [Histoplasma capsulatum var. duboisii H88]|uniref:Phosphatidylinositol:UDP-GlcNAc transferase PIG-C n=1 Tax=Ajellomyces capsulatus (strain H88) TaxID=544711 RepID=F0U881_AJEC8|nr:phosphatidylinositol:UDP-GlcNAc transferase PIG-C [Histoplasma capsulatum var. duboisii H88]QSS51881.1 phosphatidylinositol:UDP-GlcNAc transferase PIG-C [Histoplasma capsulatum var. duboisii H88]